MIMLYEVYSYSRLYGMNYQRSFDCKGSAMEYAEHIRTACNLETFVVVGHFEKDLICVYPR